MLNEQNIDVEELKKFEEQASFWWDTEGAFKSLHDITPLRIDFVAQHVDGLFDKTVLDLGCGGGIFAEALAKSGAKVTAIDMVEASLEVAKLHQLESGLSVDYHLSTAEDWALQHPQRYDLVCCLEMLEHVPDPASIVRASSELVKPGGKVIFSTLNRNPKSYMLAIIAAEYLLAMVPKGTHDYKKFIKPSELVSYVENNALRARYLSGLHFNPLTQGYYISDKNVDVNYFLVCEKVR